MLTLSLLGHSHIRQAGQTLRLSTKAVALLTYLTLENRPHHRDHLAGLLWDTPGAARNLRVELSRLRSRGLDLFPESRPMLELQLGTDLDAWLGEADDLPEARLGDWLAAVRGVPLSGLEDVGSNEFRAWIDTRRLMIQQAVETKVSRVYHRAWQRQQGHALRQLRDYARDQGLPLSEPPRVPEASGATVAAFERPELRRRLAQILEQAARTPQLVLITGRTGLSRQAMIDQVVAGTDWLTLRLSLGALQDLQQTMLLHQLWRVLGSGPDAGLPQVRLGSEKADEQLIRAWTLLAASGQKVLISIQGVAQLTSALLSSLEFAMNLPCRLMLVLWPSPLTAHPALAQAVGSFDPARVHRLEIPPLGVRDIQAVLAGRAEPALADPALAEWGVAERAVAEWGVPDPGAADPGVARATEICQRSDGWDLLAQSLISTPEAWDGASVAVPEAVRNVLLGELDELDPALRRALAKLAVVHGPLDLSLARALLGDPAPQFLAAAERQGLLVTAAAEEQVWMPGLGYRSSDTDEQLALVSEPLRVALSGSLTAGERRELRGLLARHFLQDDPPLARYYAQRSDQRDLEGQAVGRLLADPSAAEPAGETAVQAEFRTPAFAGPESRPRATPSGRGTVAADGFAMHAAEAAPVPGRLERRTGNGYRVALDRGQLQVLRYGLHARPPLLRLRWPELPPGPWRITARVDVFGEPSGLGRATQGFALGLKLPGKPALLYSPQARAAAVPPSGSAPAATGRLPCHEWFTLGGHGDGGHFELQIRALDVALTVTELEIGGVRLLPVAPGPGG